MLLTVKLNKAMIHQLIISHMSDCCKLKVTSSASSPNCYVNSNVEGFYSQMYLLYRQLGIHEDFSAVNVINAQIWSNEKSVHT